MLFACLWYPVDAVVTPGERHMTDSHHDAVRRENLQRARANGALGANASTLSHPFNGRWTRRHWAHASLFATIGALLAAIVPGFSTAMQAAPKRPCDAAMIAKKPANSPPVVNRFGSR